MTKRCPRCGLSLGRDGSCAACGRAVTPEPTAAAALAEQAPPLPARRWNRRRVLARVAAVVLLLAGAGAGAVALVGWDNVRGWLAREGWLGPQELRLCNTATSTGARDREGRLRYEWTAYLEGPPERLQQVQYVQYYLPPRTFVAPVRTVPSSPEDGFALSMNGWGTFRLRAVVTFKDGTTLELTHDLEF